MRVMGLLLLAVTPVVAQGGDVYRTIEGDALEVSVRDVPGSSAQIVVFAAREGSVAVLGEDRCAEAELFGRSFELDGVYVRQRFRDRYVGLGPMDEPDTEYFEISVTAPVWFDGDEDEHEMDMTQLIDACFGSSGGNEKGQSAMTIIRYEGDRRVPLYECIFQRLEMSGNVQEPPPTDDGQCGGNFMPNPHQSGAGYW